MFAIRHPALFRLNLVNALRLLPAPGLNLGQ